MKSLNLVSVPLFGDSFFITGFEKLNKQAKQLFPSPYSGILFLYLVKVNNDRVECTFPSPYSGILFLFKKAVRRNENQ